MLDTVQNKGNNMIVSWQEPTNRSLYLLYQALESILSRVDLFMNGSQGGFARTDSVLLVLLHIPP